MSTNFTGYHDLPIISAYNPPLKQLTTNCYQQIGKDVTLASSPQFFQTRLPAVLRPLLWLTLTGFAATLIYGIYRDFRAYTTGPEPMDTATSARPATSANPILEMKAVAQLNLMGKADAAPVAPPSQQHIPETRLKLVLRGAFTSTEPAQASALIAEKDKTSQRYFIDDVLPGGAVLSQVHPNFVTLSRNGRLEALYFPSIQPESNADANQNALETASAHDSAQYNADNYNTDHNSSGNNDVNNNSFGNNDQASTLTANPATTAQSRAESIKQRLERLRATRRAAQ